MIIDLLVDYKLLKDDILIIVGLIEKNKSDAEILRLMQTDYSLTEQQACELLSRIKRHLQNEKIMTDDKRLKRFERNMKKINDEKLDYETVGNEWIQIKTIWGEMLFNPYSNHFRLDGKLIYGNASNMIMHLNINKMI